MHDPSRMIYWDSCVFLHWIEGTPKWMPVLDSILDEVRETTGLVIVTSTVAIVEVAYAKNEKTGGRLDPSVVADMEAMWADDDVVRLVEFDGLIARKARELLRRSVELPRKLTPIDAIHLATAQQLRVSECQTTDGPLQKWNDLGFPVRDPWAPKPRLPGV